MTELKAEPVTETTAAEITVLEPITDLKIIKNVQEFVWNFSEAKRFIEGTIAKYVGLVVTNENLADMESDQKQVASIRIKVDGFRKKVRKEMDKPYKVFEGEIKELLQLIEKAETPLKDQTAKYEQERIAAKEIELNKFAQATALSMGIRNNYFVFSVDSQWTKRGAKDPAVRKEIVSLVEVMLGNQRRADELAEMEKQRIGLIEGQCIACSVGLKTPVEPVDVNHLLVGVKLSDIPGIILEECKKRADMEAKAAADAKAELVSRMAAEMVVEPPVITQQNNERFELGISFLNDGSECDMSCEDEIENSFLNDTLPLSQAQEYANQNLHVPASFIAPPAIPALPTMPPLPPMPPRNYPPMPPAQPDLYDVLLKLPRITIQQATAVRNFFPTQGVTYEIIKQEKVVDWGEF